GQHTHTKTFLAGVTRVIINKGRGGTGYSRVAKVSLLGSTHNSDLLMSGWIGFGSKCFYFSEDTRNWTFSQTFCASLEAHLARFETLEELNFLKRYKGPSDHWIGLSRESAHHTWKWTDNTKYDTSFAIKGVGECAYLNDNGISSARTYTDRKWICSKPNHYVYKCQMKSPL
uniref:C-type lectin domain-containing protein n=1 Tax=Prolemur simus TaxID=1328070 RepID=A0A8C8YPB2_PROSS